MAPKTMPRPGLWAFSTHPVDVMLRWVERKGLFLAIGWLAIILLWWLVIRHTSPAVSWNRVAILLYLLPGGLLLGYFGEEVTRFFWTRNLVDGADCLVLWVLVLAMTMDEFSLYMVGISLVYILIRATLTSVRQNWLLQASMEVRMRSEMEKNISRPYPVTVSGSLPLSAAASFDSFLEICIKYAHWLARKGLIASWEVGECSVTYLLDRGYTALRLVRRDHASSWIRVDDTGHIVVFLCHRDLERLGGKRYTLLCEKLARVFCDNFYAFILKRTTQQLV